MPEYKETLIINNVGSRNDIRMSVVYVFSKEHPGTGKNELASRYTYYVEQLEDGRRIYLRRPANLHNGFDFIVCVEGINFNPFGRCRNYPTHNDIIDDLNLKYKENPKEFYNLLSILNSVYKCSPLPDITIPKNTFSNGLSCELIIKVLKWLFIEQDIRYWNYSGRDMLWNSIVSIVQYL